jgi:hypothetical protein
MTLIFAAVDGGVFCHDGFASYGEIRLRGMRVTGQFDLGAVPVYTAADRLGAGDLQPSRISGSVDLRHARIAHSATIPVPGRASCGSTVSPMTI